MDGWVDRYRNIWMEGWMIRWENEGVDHYTDGWVDGWMNELTTVAIYKPGT